MRTEDGPPGNPQSTLGGTYDGVYWPGVTNPKTTASVGRPEYRLVTKKASEATEAGVVVSILFEHIIGS